MGVSVNDHEKFMALSLVEAEEAGKRGDLPIGAVIVHNGKVIAKGSNRKHTKQSLVAHAEIDVIHQCASYLKNHNKECVILYNLGTVHYVFVHHHYCEHHHCIFRIGRCVYEYT